jgi:hypothetical protein
MTRPATVVRRVGGGRDQAAERVARVLGVRQLLQAAFIDQRRAAIGSGVDVAHAATMVFLAVADRRRRRLAMGSAILASVFAVVGFRSTGDRRVAASGSGPRPEQM